MNILVTGAKGFVGKNLCAQLRNIAQGKAKFYGDVIETAGEFTLTFNSLADKLIAFALKVRSKLRG